jgi:hypothetical protein
MKIRTIAVFHCHSFPGTAWCCADGIVNTLTLLGYHVLDCGHPKLDVVPIETLQQADLIILSGAEFYNQVLVERYGQAWHELTATKVAWYTESVHRDDYTFPTASYMQLANRHYFPAIQDAEEFGGEWLPFGADTVVFNPSPVEKRYGAIFIGSMYKKRIEYVKDIGSQLTFVPAVYDKDQDQLRGFQMLADAYSAARIFVNLPSLSRLLVTKVTEVMACRTMLITPAIDHPSGTRNMTQFEDGKHLVYYDPGRPRDIGPLIEHYLSRPAEVDAIANAGWQEITRAHTLRQRLEKIISDAATAAGAG